MSNLVIVAIPAEDDYVWKISSEKVPHMTLLFLGDIEGKPVMKIQEFLEHAVNILEMGPFGMDVEYRDTLGPDEADVLFFRKDYWSYKRIAEFRSQLLKNTPIKSAYDSVAQYEEWTPHLTLGYPATPAKEDTRDYSGIHWVQFDKIALWYGDYEGPEFRLTYKYDLNDSTGIAYAEAGADFLSHVGVKGMKWGVRRSRPKTDTAWQKHLDSKKGQKAVFNEMERIVNKQVKTLNADPRWGDGDLTKNKKLGDQYVKEYLKMVEDAHTSAVATVHGKSPSGKMIAATQEGSNKIIITHVARAKHGDDSITFILTRDKKGFITTMKMADDSMAQATELVNSLIHYGVLGMKWGHRKARMPVDVHVQSIVRSPDAAKTKIKAKGGENHPATEDALKAASQKQKLKKSGAHSLTNTELRQLADRMNLEQQVTRLASNEPKTAGKRFVESLTSDPNRTIGNINKSVENVTKVGELALKLRP